MRHTSYDELIWTCQDNQAMPFLMDLGECLKRRKARAVLLDAPVLVERDPSKDPDLSVASDHGALFLAFDYPVVYAPLATMFSGGEDNAFAKTVWLLAGILVSNLDTGTELMPVMAGVSDGRKVVWPDVPRLFMRGDGGCLSVSLSCTNPMSGLYRSMRETKSDDEKATLDKLVGESRDIYHMVEETCRWLEGKKLEAVPPKPPKLKQRTATRIKVVHRGYMGYLKVWEQRPKQPTTTTPTS